jgi:hypothetical protein
MASGSSGGGGGSSGERGSDEFAAMRSRLHDDMDRLIDGAAALNRQLCGAGGEDCSDTLRAIKKHVRDETEEFTSAAIFISLRVNNLFIVASKAKLSGDVAGVFAACGRVWLRALPASKRAGYLLFTVF